MAEMQAIRCESCPHCVTGNITLPLESMNPGYSSIYIQMSHPMPIF
jgi:hypothetical protein